MPPLLSSQQQPQMTLLFRGLRAKSAVVADELQGEVCEACMHACMCSQLSNGWWGGRSVLLDWATALLQTNELKVNVGNASFILNAGVWYGMRR